MPADSRYTTKTPTRGFLSLRWQCLWLQIDADKSQTHSCSMAGSLSLSLSLSLTWSDQHGILWRRGLRDFSGSLCCSSFSAIRSLQLMIALSACLDLLSIWSVVKEGQWVNGCRGLVCWCQLPHQTDANYHIKVLLYKVLIIHSLRPNPFSVLRIKQKHITLFKSMPVQ